MTDKTQETLKCIAVKTIQKIDKLETIASIARITYTPTMYEVNVTVKAPDIIKEREPYITYTFRPSTNTVTLYPTSIPLYINPKPNEIQKTKETLENLATLHKKLEEILAECQEQ